MCIFSNEEETLEDYLCPQDDPDMIEQMYYMKSTEKYIIERFWRYFDDGQFDE